VCQFLLQKIRGQSQGQGCAAVSGRPHNTSARVRLIYIKLRSSLHSPRLTIPTYL